MNLFIVSNFFFLHKASVGKLSWHWMQINTHGNNSFEARKYTNTNLNHKKFEVIQWQSGILNINDSFQRPKNVSNNINFQNFQVKAVFSWPWRKSQLWRGNFGGFWHLWDTKYICLIFNSGSVYLFVCLSDLSSQLSRFSVVIPVFMLS
jgi:hypothetical protein